MQQMKRIYQTSVGEVMNGNLKKAYSEICYTKQEAVDFCLGVLHKRIREIRELEVVMVKDILDFMNDDTYKFNLSVQEYSARRRNYEDTSSYGYGKAFQKFVKQGGEELYDNLLSLVVCNTTYLDYFGNVKDVWTDKNAFVGYSGMDFTEEDCWDGKYRADFSYSDYKGDFSYTTPQYFYFAFSEVYREVFGDDNEYSAWDTGAYENLEEVVGYVSYSVYDDMALYFQDEESDEYIELTEQQKKEVFKEKVTDYTVVVRTVSPKRLRFDSIVELADYYAERISSGEISEDNMYDFLLSLVQYEERHYDNEENFLYSRVKLQELDGTTAYNVIPDFSMETAKNVWKRQQLLKEKLCE